MKHLVIILTLIIPFFSFAKPIANSADEVTPLLVGQTIPDISITTLKDETTSLKQYLNNKKTILFFYRGGWCPFCNTQMGQLKAIEPELKKLGFNLLGISTDANSGLKKSIEKMDLGYELLSDYNSNISKAFGIAFFTDDKTTKRYLKLLQLTNPLQKNVNGEERLVLPVPAIYVIDEKGLVHFNYVNPNFRVRLKEDVLLSVAKNIN